MIEFPEGLCSREWKVVDVFLFVHYNFQMESYANWECALKQCVGNYSLRAQVAQDCSLGHWM